MPPLAFLSFVNEKPSLSFLLYVYIAIIEIVDTPITFISYIRNSLGIYIRNLYICCEIIFSLLSVLCILEPKTKATGFTLNIFHFTNQTCKQYILYSSLNTFRPVPIIANISPKKGSVIHPTGTDGLFFVPQKQSYRTLRDCHLNS